MAAMPNRYVFGFIADVERAFDVRKNRARAPGTLFDAIHLDHANGFAVLNPKQRD